MMYFQIKHAKLELERNATDVLLSQRLIPMLVFGINLGFKQDKTSTNILVLCSVHCTVLIF